MSYQKQPAYNCQICGTTLVVLSDADNQIVSMKHTGANLARMGIEDHDPVPVRLDELAEPTFLCDFCLKPGARWLLPVTDHPMIGGAPDDPIHMDINGWGACDTCAIALRFRNWDLLVTRTMHGNAMRADRKEPWAIWKLMIDDLRPYISGPVRLYQKGDVT